MRSFQQLIQKFSASKLDTMEFYLLKNVTLFKTDLFKSQLAEKQRVEQIQEESFCTLFNYNRANYPETARFGKLVSLYTDLRRFASANMIEDSFFRHFFGRNNSLSNLMIHELNK